MRDKILALLKKEAPGIKWSVAFGDGYENKENAPPVASFFITGEVGLDDGDVKSMVMVPVSEMLDRYGCLIEKSKHPVIDLSGGPAYAFGVGMAEWVGGVIVAVEAEIRAKIARQA